MLKMNTVVAAQATTANGTGVEQATSPYLPGTTVVSVVIPNAFSGTSILQGSDDNSTWSTLHTSGALTTGSVTMMKEITLPKYVRYSTTRSAGSVTHNVLNGG